MRVAKGHLVIAASHAICSSMLTMTPLAITKPILGPVVLQLFGQATAAKYIKSNLDAAILFSRTWAYDKRVTIT